ncbi:hypothetical protein FRY77_27635 [Halomonas sp. MG34]|nr:hypothetical protein [Halomonas sp. MG34]
MRLFGLGDKDGKTGKAGEITYDEPNMDGRIIARITVDRIDRHRSKVKAFAVERATGKTVYRLRYGTQKNGQSAYFEAENYVKAFATDNGFIIDGNISTNVDLPYVKTIAKRTR